MPRSPRRRGVKRTLLPFWLLLPTVLFVAVIQVYPAIYTVWLSVQQRQPSGWVYVGLDNFKRLLSLSRFSESTGHTVVFLVGYASLAMLLGFLIALLLNRTTHLSGLYLTLIFVPWTIADLLAGVVIRLLVQPDYGLLSGVLQNPALFPPDGLSFLTDTRPPPWIGDFPFPPSPAMVLLILVATWRALPFVTLLMLAALQTVPSEILESSKIDGANEFQIARLILIPLMLPTMVVALSNLILTGMNGVGTVFSLTRGGPGSSTDVLSYMLYTIGWRELNFGRAAAMALMIAAVNLLLITGTLRLTRVEERSRQDA